MIEHVSIPVSDMKKASDFYTKAVESLGYTLYRDYAPEAVGYLEGESTSLWLAQKEGEITPIHVALRGTSKEAVQKFYEEGLRAGGTDNGAPWF